MNQQQPIATGATWVGTPIKSQKPLSGEELSRNLNEAIQLNAAQGLTPISVHPVQAATRYGVVTNGFVVVWGVVVDAVTAGMTEWPAELPVEKPAPEPAEDEEESSEGATEE